MVERKTKKEILVKKLEDVRSYAIKIKDYNCADMIRNVIDNTKPKNKGI